MLAPTMGHNRPPGPIASAHEALSELSDFLREHPVISSPAEAKNGGAFIERTRIALNEMETERTDKVAPLNKELAAINGAYRVIREPLEKVLKELRRRLTDYANAVEAKRIEEANRLAAEREAAERAAREAEAREADAMAAVDVGACEDVGTAIVDADAAFKEFEKADRAAATAAKNVPVRIGSVMGNRALSMRTVEVLVIDDANAAIKAMGLTEKIRDAILSSARDFRKAHDELPNGVTATYERSL